MKILFDTNVILDLLLVRQPFLKAAELLVASVELSKCTGLLCATSLTTIDYLMTKKLGVKKSKDHIKQLLRVFEIAPVNRLILESAIDSKIVDYEDAVIYEAATHGGAEAIVTRNQKDFQPSKIPIFNPDELVLLLTSLQE